ncbi:MAG: hypothetical protein COA36_09675 [Desulfotalea sp.]|nr:MAG: hypothetical protein COA36_09675 [Desulfotalea sp.]
MNTSYNVNEMRNTAITGVPISISAQAGQGAPFTPFGTLAATLVIASAASIGSNLVDVRNGSLTLPLAVVNGVAKGAVASYILAKTTRSTAGEVLIAAGFLAGAAYLIDAKMKKSVQLEVSEEGSQC